MNKSTDRFKLCDLRFHSFFRRVMERLPSAVRENVMNDKSFQIITDDDVFHGSVLRYEFSHPVKSLVYLNSKILTEPDHRIIHRIAFEIAHYMLKKERIGVREKLVDEKLIEWGFGQELEAVHFDRAIAESKSYRIGYDWAKKQSRDYLMQHFGLYFDEWNERGLGRISTKGSDSPVRGAAADTILDKIDHEKDEKKIEQAGGKRLEKFSSRKAILAGILAAIKESTLDNFYSSKTTTSYHILC